MTLTVLEPPVSPAVFAAEARSFLRLGGAGEDTFIESLIIAAQARLESALSMVLLRQKLHKHLGYSDRARLVSGASLSVRPVTAIHAVHLQTDDGQDDEVTGLFELGAQGSVRLKDSENSRTFPYHGHLDVTFTAGFGPDPADVPADLKLAINRLVADSYFARNDTVPSAAETGFPTDVAHIVATYRAIRL